MVGLTDETDHKNILTNVHVHVIADETRARARYHSSGQVSTCLLRLKPLCHRGGDRMRPMYLSFLTVITVVVAFLTCASAQVNNAGQKPYLGWSSFSQQTIQGDFLTQANMITQSDALKASGLQDHGFLYINLDSGWRGSFDGNGRPIPNSTTFPDIKAILDHIHPTQPNAAIYWIPGIEQPAVDGNYPILGTSYHPQDIVVTPYAKGDAFAT